MISGSVVKASILYPKYYQNQWSVLDYQWPLAVFIMFDHMYYSNFLIL